jgi:hypothetical protein
VIAHIPAEYRAPPWPSPPSARNPNRASGNVSFVRKSSRTGATNDCLPGTVDGSRTVASCRSLEIVRPTFYRRIGISIEEPPTPSPAPPRALIALEQQTVLAILHTDRLVDRAPTEVYATLLEEGIYHCCYAARYSRSIDAHSARELAHVRSGLSGILLSSHLARAFVIGQGIISPS